MLVTEWDELVGLDWAAVAAEMSGDLLIDGRNALTPSAVRGRRAHIRGHREAVSKSRR